MSGKLLSRMTARGMILDGTGGAGKLQISSTDVAGALAYGALSEQACHMAFAKYCDDSDAGRKLLDHLEDKIQNTINRNRWRDAPGRARGLALAVYLEEVHRPSCARCAGSGAVREGAATRRCRHCGGTGTGRLSGSRKAAIAGMSRSSWSRTWETRTREWAAYVSELESELIKHIQAQLFTLNG